MSKASSRPEIVFVQTTIPDYRLRFFASLSEALGAKLEVVCGDEDFALDLLHAGNLDHVRVRNRFLVRRRLLWQSGVLRRVVPAPTAVLVLNPRILSNWVALLVRRLRGRKTILWGHTWPRRGPEAATDRVRRLMRRLATTLIVYTETEAAELRALDSKLDVVAAPNALYRERELGPVGTATPTDFLYVGRLNEEKKPETLLTAFELAEPDLPEDVRLVYAGDGPLRSELETRARTERPDRVVFLGHVSEIDTLRDAYARAIASVTPGTAGLSLIQSLGFGVPVVLAPSELHGPEIEAASEGENAVFVGGDSASALAAALAAVASRRDEWRSRRDAIAASIAARYSVEAMVRAFLSALDPGVEHGNEARGHTPAGSDGRESSAVEVERS